MSQNINIEGGCLCGGVSIAAKAEKKSIGVCHCSMCRKWTGGPLVTIECGTDVSFTGEDNVSVFNSSAWAERGFCKQCGSHLFYRLKEANKYTMPAALFSGVDDFVFDHQIFIDEKPPYYDFANDTEKITGAEIFAMYAPKE